MEGKIIVSWIHLDRQMSHFSARLVSDVKATQQEAQKIATFIASETRSLPNETKFEIKDASPVEISDRLEELKAFQGWSEFAQQSRKPFVVRAHVLTQNYICFVYLPESCFSTIYKKMPSGSLAKRCSKYLINDRIRSFRNAIAHANWCYREDFGALKFWARKGTDNNEPLAAFEVTNEELQFWQSLSRCVAYAAFSNLAHNG